MSEPLLTYALGWSSTPLLAGSTASLSVTADNTSGREVELSSVAIALPLGGNADDLTTSPGGSVPPAGWGAAGSTIVTFTPSDGKPVPVRGQGITFELTGIALNSQPGTTRPIEVVETAAPKGGRPVTGTYSEPVKKFPAGFSLSDVTADPTTPIPYGGDVILNWQGSANASYTLERSDRPHDPPEAVGPAGPHREADLTGSGGIVAFNLVATITVPNGGPLVYEKPCVVTIVPPAPSIGSFTATVAQTTAGPKLTVSWDVQHVDEVTVTGLSTGPQFPTPHSESLHPTPSKPLPTVVTLSAHNDNGQVSRALYLTWGTAANASDDDFQGAMALADDGERIYAADGPSSLQVLDALTLTPHGSVRVGWDAGPVGVSPDGSRAYVAAYDGTNKPALYEVDVSTPVPTLLGQPAPLGAVLRSDFVLVRRDGQMVFTGNGDISVTPVRTGAGSQLQPLASIAVGGDFPISGDLTPDGTSLICLGGGSPAKITVIGLDSLEVTHSGPAGIGASMMAPLARDGTIVVYGTGGSSSEGPLPTGLATLDSEPPFTVQCRVPGDPEVAGALVSADGLVVYAVGSDAVMSPRWLDTLEPLPLPQPTYRGFGFGALAQTRDGTRLYVMDSNGIALLTPAGYVEAA